MIDAHELVFAVDENDSPAQPVERSVAHAKGVWHRVSHVAVYQKDGQILCEKRSMKKDVGPGMWNCVLGGHISVGQSALEGAMSELAEETSLQVAGEKLKKLMVFKYQSTDGRIREFQYVYSYEYDGPDEALAPEPDEIEQLAWFALSEVKAKVIGEPNWVHLGYESEILGRIEELCQTNR